MGEPDQDTQKAECRLCGAFFEKSAPQQVYCSQSHKKEFEKILSTLMSEIREPLKNAAHILAAAKMD